MQTEMRKSMRVMIEDVITARDPPPKAAVPMIPEVAIEEPLTVARVVLSSDDWIKIFMQRKLPSFNGAIEEKIELLFRLLEGAFEAIKASKEKQTRLAASLLRGDAFDRWTLIRPTELAQRTFGEFQRRMIREYLLAGPRKARERAFLREGYNPSLNMIQTVQLFKR